MEACMASSCTAAWSPSSTSLFSQLIHVLLASQCSLSRSDDYPPDRTEEIMISKREFDFVIVGGGTAGSILAHRLTEVKNWDVLLIEAGGDPMPETDVPGMMLVMYGQSQDYAYKMEPQEGACLGMRNNQCRWSKGKALGGSSVINAMLHIFGNDRDYNEWASLGNEGWSYDEVLPYFTKSLNCPSEHIAKWGTKYCGSGGPMNIRSYNYTNGIMQDIVLDGARELGLDILEPLNGNRFVGYGRGMGTIDSSRRINAAKAFLSPIKDRKNLFVMKNSRVDKILLENNKATGVRVTLRNGRTVNIKASKEVILSAGSIASPQILMLSGIGPKEHLEEIGLPIVADLPVGKNLQDHLIWTGIHIAHDNELTRPPAPTFALDIAYELLVHNSGELATIGIDLQAFVNVSDSRAKYPDIQINFGHFPRWNPMKVGTVMEAFHVKDDMVRQIQKDIMEADLIVAFPILLKPKSRGRVELRSTNPAEPVKIYANYFAEEDDLKTLVKSVRSIKALLNTDTVKKNKMRLKHFDIPGCRHTVPDSDEYWECSARHLAASMFHAVGTARMGPAGDKLAVVDPRLRVHGIERLRVIDASIMPTIVSANTNAPTMMIAEKAADLVKQDWKVGVHEDL